MQSGNTVIDELLHKSLAHSKQDTSHSTPTHSDHDQVQSQEVFPNKFSSPPSQKESSPTHNPSLFKNINNLYQNGNQAKDAPLEVLKQRRNPVS